MADTFDILQCDRCGYDLRATDADGVCPECGFTVADSVEAAKLPRRPAWRDSDPRWRRRMLAGCWVLALTPMLPFLHAADLTSTVRVPGLFTGGGAFQPLDNALLLFFYPFPVTFLGYVLLMSPERGRPFRWIVQTRRYGLFFCAAFFISTLWLWSYIFGLVLRGIDIVFQSIPAADQPGWSDLAANLATFLLAWGTTSAWPELILLSMIALLSLSVAAVLFEACRRCMPAFLSVVLTMPFLLVGANQLIALASIAVSGSFDSEWTYISFDILSPSSILAVPSMLASHSTNWLGAFTAFLDVALWLSIALIAIWLSAANRSPREAVSGFR